MEKKRILQVTLKTAAIMVLLSAAAVAQTTTVKLFDAVSIQKSSETLGSTFAADNFVTYASNSLILDCSGVSHPSAVITGPQNGGLVVDDSLRVENSTAGKTAMFVGFSSITRDPMDFQGQTAQPTYQSLPPIDITRMLSAKAAQFNFKLVDFGYTYASTEIDLTTSCKVINQVCHWDSGKRTFRTLSVDPTSLQDHLSHQLDYVGQCK